MTTKHDAYVGVLAGGRMVLKCACGFEVTKKTESVTEMYAEHPAGAPHAIEVTLKAARAALRRIA